MPKLTDTALILLSNAAKRDTGLVLPLPKSLKGGAKAAGPILQNLLKKKLLTEQEAAGAAPVWREADGQLITLAITSAGLKAIGAETEPKEKPKKAAGKKAPAGKNSKAGTKIDVLKGMLASKDGMTVAEASKATGWLVHSVRGVMSGVLKKKLGLDIQSEKVEGRGRVYRLAA